MRTTLIRWAFDQSDAMKTEGVEVYPGYVNRLVEEARESRTNVETESDREPAQFAN